MKLDYSLLYKLFCLCYENSSDLLEDAKILYEKERYARAYTLAHLAIEEIAKLPMINTYMYGVLHGKDFDVPHLLKRMSNHKEKIEMSYSIVDLVDEDEVFNTLEDPNEIKKFISNLNDLKNNSIYVGLDKGVINSPKEIFNQEIVKGIIDTAEKHIHFHRERAGYSEEQFKEIHSDEIFKKFANYKE